MRKNGEYGQNGVITPYIVYYDESLVEKLKKVNKIGYIQGDIGWCIIQLVVLCYKIKERRNLL